MKIDHQPGESGRPARFTVTYEPREDPHGRLAALLTTPRLENLLMALIRAPELGGDLTRDRLENAIADLAWFAEKVQGAAYPMAVRAHDQYGTSWNTLAEAFGVSRSTVKDRVDRIRTAMAAGHGIWIDWRGVHHDAPQNALKELSRRGGASAAAR